MTTAERAEESVDPLNLLGRRLRERRRELGLTLAEVAAAAGISVGHSSSIEKGTTLPSLPVLARVAHALDLTLAEVLRASPSPRIAHGKIAPTPGTSRLVSSGSRIQIAYLWQPAGTSSSPPFPLSGDDIFVFVHTGAVEIKVNEDRHELAGGDSIHCHAPRAIVLSASSSAGAGTVWVTRTPRSRERLEPVTSTVAS
jgi:transcriptional regulator with XRE-family HTH domain